jgi:hypothetical protein
MKLGNIDKVITGPAIQRNRMNQTAHAVNYLMRKKKPQPEPRVRASSSSSGIRWYKLDDVSASPMTAWMVKFDADTESWVLSWNDLDAWADPTPNTYPKDSKVKHASEFWIATTATSDEPAAESDWDIYREDVYPHPECSFADYQTEQITPCGLSGGYWHSLDSAGGSAVVWGIIIRGLTYPDPEGEGDLVAGYDQYIVRLLSDSYTAWSAGTYTTGTIRTHSGRAYVVVATPSTAQEPPHADWEVLDELSPCPLCQEAEEADIIGSPPDMRLFVPWYQIDDVVPLVTRSVTVGETTQTLYFFDLQMTKVVTGGEDPSKQSIMWNDTDNRIMAVFA